jgi:DNA-binding CsgD family transcriptional regulator
MEDNNNIPTSRKKTGPKPKDLITVEVTGYEVGRGITKRVVFDEDVYKLAAMGCSDSEIALWFDIKLDTLRYNFANIMAKGRDDLKQSLRRSQIRLALSGNAVMLIWLGKNILGQSDTPINSEANAPLPWSDNE